MILKAGSPLPWTTSTRGPCHRVAEPIASQRSSKSASGGSSRIRVDAEAALALLDERADR